MSDTRFLNSDHSTTVCSHLNSTHFLFFCQNSLNFSKNLWEIDEKTGNVSTSNGSTRSYNGRNLKNRVHVSLENLGVSFSKAVLIIVFRLWFWVNLRYNVKFFCPKIWEIDRKMIEKSWKIDKKKEFIDYKRLQRVV